VTAPATLAEIETPVDLVTAVDQFRAVLELALVACNQDASRAIGALLGAFVALAVASPDRVAIAHLAEVTLAQARRRWQEKQRQAVPS